MEGMRAEHQQNLCASRFMCCSARESSTSSIKVDNLILRLIRKLGCRQSGSELACLKHCNRMSSQLNVLGNHTTVAPSTARVHEAKS
eukprot:5410674-Amphidinium_carterae.1